MRWMMVFFVILFGGAVSAQAEVYRTSELGWSRGRDVGETFGDFLTNTAAGDELVVEGKYRISGTHDLPDDLTITGVEGGGFDVTDAESDQTRAFLRLGNRNTLRNLNIKYLNTPEPGPAGTHPVRGEDYYPMTGITIVDKSDILIEACKLYGSINHHLKVAGGSQIQVLKTHVVGGYWTIYLAGDVSDVEFRHCVIERCQGDGIKTGRGGAFGVKRVLVDSCVFQDNGREDPLENRWRTAKLQRGRRI